MIIHTKYIFRRVCALPSLVLSRSSCIALYVSLDIEHHPLQLVALRWCPSVVIFILPQHRPSRVIDIQYGRSTSSLVSRLVNIPVSAFVRGLPIILLFNPNLESFNRDPGHYEISVIISWWLSQMSHDAIRWLSFPMPFGRLFGMFQDHFRFRWELLQ